MVTSAGPSEGKTSIAGNLAVALAQTGKRTVVVGGDLRKPTVHQLFGLPNAVGLTNVLLGQASLDDAMKETPVENLKVITAGPTPPNPAELLGSKAMENVLRELTKAYDFIIIDAPPVIAVADALIMSRYVDGTLLVVAMNQTPRELVKRAKDQLDQVGAKLLGVVANKTEIKGNQGYYYYYYSEESPGAATNGHANGRRRFGFLGRIIGR